MYELEVGIFSELPIQKSFDFLSPSSSSSSSSTGYRNSNSFSFFVFLSIVAVS